VDTNEFRFRVKGEALASLDTLRKITGRGDVVDVVIDALRVYEWILHHQASNRKIISRTETPAQGVELPSYVKDLETARAYFTGLDAVNSPHPHGGESSAA
jgi:hypothetical protein